MTADLPTDPRSPKTTSLSSKDEAIVVAFRKHVLLPLDDCLYTCRPVVIEGHWTEGAVDTYKATSPAPDY